jgi:hypothetical protein
MVIVDGSDKRRDVRRVHKGKRAIAHRGSQGSTVPCISRCLCCPLQLGQADVRALRGTRENLRGSARLCDRPPVPLGGIAVRL